MSKSEVADMIGVGRYTRRQVAHVFLGGFLVIMLFVLGSRNTSTMHAPSDDVRVSEVINIGLQLLKEAGKTVVVHRYEGVQAKKVKGLTKEGKKEFVTQGDLKSHRILYGNLQATFPGINIVSEEHDGDYPSAQSVALSGALDEELVEAITKNGDSIVSQSDLTVWIDPLDATQEYTELLDQYVTVMMCVVFKGQPIAGLMHFPFEGVTFWQWREHHFSKSFSDVAVRKKSRSRVLKAIVSRSHAGEVNRTLHRTFGKNVRVIPAGGAGYKVMQLVNGRADMYVHSTAIKKWDICVGDSMLRHVGGKMATLQGELLDYRDPAKFIVTDGFLAVARRSAFDDIYNKLTY